MEHKDYSYDNDNYYDRHPSDEDDSPGINPKYEDSGFENGILGTVVVFGLPLTLLAMALCLKGLKDHVAPVYVINLLISNLIQLCCFIVFLTNIYPMMNISNFIYFFGFTANVFFRLVVATDRCLFITRPEWYMDRTSITRSVVVSVGIWALSVVVLCIIIFCFALPLFYIAEFLFMSFGVFLLVPFLLLLFLLVGSVKASFAASSDKNNSNLVILVLLLLFYAVLFLPHSISLLLQNIGIQQTFIFKTSVLLYFIPVADLVVYVFIRKANNKPHAVAVEQTAHQQHEMDGI